jgi:hypothetical protein
MTGRWLGEWIYEISLTGRERNMSVLDCADRFSFNSGSRQVTLIFRYGSIITQGDVCVSGTEVDKPGEGAEE